MTDKYFSLPCSVLPKFVLVYFLLAIILLSVLRITASDHPFGIFKKYVYLVRAINDILVIGVYSCSNNKKKLFD